MMDKIKLDSIEDAIADIRDGKMIIVVDDEDRENEGDIIVAAEKITPEQVNFMLKNARGVLCAPITISRCRELGLNPQVDENTSVLGTPFTVTVDKLEGCSTGVSINDRDLQFSTFDFKFGIGEDHLTFLAVFQCDWFSIAAVFVGCVINVIRRFKHEPLVTRFLAHTVLVISW